MVTPILNLNSSSPMLNLWVHNIESLSSPHVEFESSSIWNLNLSSPMLNLRVHNWELELNHVKIESSSTWHLNLSSHMLNLRVHNWEFKLTHVRIWEFIHVGLELEFTHVWIWEYIIESSPMLNLRVHPHGIWTWVHPCWIWECIIESSSSPMFEFESQRILNEFMFPLLCFMNTHVWPSLPYIQFFSLITCKKLYLWQFLFSWAAQIKILSITRNTRTLQCLTANIWQLYWLPNTYCTYNWCWHFFVGYVFIYLFF